MKYTSEDVTVYKSKKEYWLTMNPTRENKSVQLYLRRIKKKVDSKYLEQFIKILGFICKIGIILMKNSKSMKRF